MAFGTTVAADIADAALDFFVRGPALLQSQQDRPLLAYLNEGKQTFPSGKQYISEPVQGAVMADSSGFFAGYSEDDTLTFQQAQNIKRARVEWKEVHAGFVITFTELKKDGISVTDGEARTSQHTEVELTRLTGLLENRMADFSESWARAMNLMCWRDGSADAKQMPGLTSILTENINSGTVEGLDKGTYAWWRSRVKLDLVPSPENQTITKFFRNEIKQLRRYGGRPNRILCGSEAWAGLMEEVERKGLYTQTGFTGGVDVDLQRISVKGIGVFDYDPTLDDEGKARYFFVLDSTALKYRPMEGEENKTYAPARPYQYMLMLKSMTNTSGLIARRLNGMGVYRLAA